MGTSRSSVEFNELFAHADWVRGVARELVGDSSLADDVVQDTWVAVLRRPPGDRNNLRGWLRRVVSNRARQSGRGETRRRRREAEVARPEAQASLTEVAERVALQREVIDHVLELEEPFRSVVLLRFFECLSPPEIAQHLGIPLKTVHSRQQRAFEKLRRKLTSEYGSRREWCSALLPFMANRETLPLAMGASIATSSGVWIMNVNAKIAVAIGLALVGGLGLWRTDLVGPAPSGAAPTQPRALTPNSISGPGAQAEAPSQGTGSSSRASVESVSVTDTRPLATLPVRGFTCRGRALDVHGAPLAGLAVALGRTSSEPLTVTGADGSFELLESDLSEASLSFMQAFSGSACLSIADDRWVTLRQSCIREINSNLQHIIVAAPAIRLEGWVEDVDGSPLEGTRITLSPRGKEFYGFPYALDMTRFVAREASSDASGRFLFERFPDVPGQYLHVAAKGFVAVGIELDQAERPLVLQLQRLEDSGQVYLEGVVLDSTGRTVEGASIQLAEAKAVTDRAGLFRILVGHVAEGTPLCAASKGHLPALIRNFGAVIERQGGNPVPVELILGGPPLEIHGRVIDGEGQPCVGWVVSTVDEIEISQFRIPIDTAEGLARGGAERVKTDAEGRFQLSGLFARDYVVQAYDRQTLQRTEASIAAGDHAATLQARGKLLDAVRGTVVSLDGMPMSGVRVALALDIIKGSVGSSSTEGAAVVTSESGAFAFEEVPADFVYLRLFGEGILPGSHGLELEEGAPLVIEVIQRCHFRIELADTSGGPDSAEFLDASGRPLQINQFQAQGMSASGSTPIEAGASAVLSVSETAATLILKKEGQEVSRHVVTLIPEEVNVLRF